jgi:hypothetical protein
MRTTLCVLSLGLLGGLLVFAFRPSAHGDDPPKKDPPKAEIKRVDIAKNVVFEKEGDQRRVIVKSYVCLREGTLEGLLCRKFTKEHEYILAVDADARDIHAALLAAGAKPGNPVKFDPKFVPATGPTIKVTLRYKKDDKLVTVPAQDWIRNGAANKNLEENWVFGGSMFVPNDDKTKPDIYLANQGDVICLVNMESAMLDLPIRSTKRLEERSYQAITDKIPDLNTPVDVILEVVPDKK